MNKLIERFGDIVEGSVKESPKRAFKLLKAGYIASMLYLKLLPNKKLLPHQRYVALMCNRAILNSLIYPENSAVINIFFPCELLHAMNIFPQFTEGLAGYLNGAACEQVFIDYAESAGIPQTYCSYHKVLLGAYLSGVMPAPKFVATTSFACDANNNTFRIIAEHCKVPYYLVDIPGVYSEEAVAYVARQLRELTAIIQEVVGKKMDVEKLKVIIQRANRSLKLYKEYLKLLSGKYLTGDLTSEMYRIFPTHVLLGTVEAEEYFRLLLRDVKEARPARGEKRILWGHTIPYWQESIRELLNSSERYQLLLCDLNFDCLEEMEVDRPYESLARRILLNIANGKGENRARALLQMARHLKADGVVYFCHWGCKQTLGNARLVSEVLQQEGFPVLILDGDGCDRKNINDGQMSTKLQAFLEMLEVNA